MRIGIFSDTYYPEINGVATSVFELRNGLLAAGHKVFVFTVSNSDAKLNDKSERNVYRVPSIPFATLKERRIGFPNSVKYMNIIERLKLDVIHTQTEFSVGSLGKRAARKFNIPLVHTYHTLYEDYIHYLKIPKNDFTFSLVGKFVKNFTNNCDLIIVPTDKVVNSMHEYKVTKPVKVIPTGLDLDKFQNVDQDHVAQIRKKYNLNTSDLVLSSIGRISQEKSLDQIISHFDQLSGMFPDIKLFIVGDGPGKEELEKLRSELGLTDRIIFTGYVDWNNIQDYYAAGDIFVSASESETQGLTYSEALAAGLPLLVKDDTCLKNVLKHKQNGYGFIDQSDFIQGFIFIKNKLAQNPAWGTAGPIYSRQDFITSVIETYAELSENYDQAEAAIL